MISKHLNFAGLVGIKLGQRVSVSFNISICQALTWKPKSYEVSQWPSLNYFPTINF